MSINTMMLLLIFLSETECMASTRYTTAGLFVTLAAIWGLSFVATRAVLFEDLVQFTDAAALDKLRERIEDVLVVAPVVPGVQPVETRLDTSF